MHARLVLFGGALGMLLISAALGDAAGVGAIGTGGTALLAHVHAGSLGWMTLAVLAVAATMTQDGPDQPLRSPAGSGLSWLLVATIAAFVIADATGSAAAQAWTGTAALAAIVACLIWLAAAFRKARPVWTVPRLAMAAALAVLVAGAVIGAIAAGAAAGGNASAAADLTSAHSAALAVPFVVLAATSVLEWSASPRSSSAPPTTAGLVQVGAFVLAAVAVITGVLAHNLTLVEANIPLQFGGIAIFLVRVGPVLLADGWTRGGRIWLVTGTVALAADVGLFAHVVYEIGAQRYLSIDVVPPWLLFTVDHTTYVAVGTSALFGAIAAMAGPEARWPAADVAAAAGLVVGLIGTALGIGIGAAALEGAAAALLGISLLAAAVMAAIRIWIIPKQARAPAAAET